MRRIPLDPPRPVRAEVAETAPELPGIVRPDDRATGDGPARARERPLRGSLGRPVSAAERRRPLFHPRRGWVRRFERFASHWLARELFPLVPGVHLPYDRQLRRQLTLSQADVSLAGLPRAFDGTRVLFLSDLHAGPFVSPRALRETVERLLALEPDLVLLGGDLVTSHAREIASHRRVFETLRAPLGVFAVLGNHDHYSREPERVRRTLDRSGIAVLHNRAVTLRRAGARLDLAGVDDLVLGDADLEAALAQTRPPVVLLSHNPDLLFDAARHDVALMLSGHTHGGQIRIPGLPVLVRQSCYRLDEGRFRVNGTELIVSRGLGAVALPWRVGCPPEALLLRLRSAS